MYADTLLLIERITLLRLVAWACGSLLLGIAVLAFAASRNVRVPLLEQFSVQMAAWGSAELVITAMFWRALSLRDAASAARLNATLLLNTGLSIGVVILGATLAVSGWIIGKRLASVGAGIGVVVQGIALLLVNLAFMNSIVRLTQNPV